ncbi:MAG: hypothetical protein KGQ38_02700 [Actinomycetales bacterium]|nr:hypothetical protein [Actinomycetales bacterium]
MQWRKDDAFWGTVFNSANPHVHAQFYCDLLGWRIHTNTDNWVTVVTSADNIYLGFQRQTELPIEKPVWPAHPGKQQMLNHLDIEVSDLGGAVDAALNLGAELAEHQPQSDVRVMVDPEGHYFCLYVDD